MYHWDLRERERKKRILTTYRPKGFFLAFSDNLGFLIRQFTTPPRSVHMF